MLWGRGAWDTLFLAAVLGEVAQVRSVCGAPRAPMHLGATPCAVEALEPAGTLPSMLEQQEAMRDDLTRHF